MGNTTFTIDEQDATLTVERIFSAPPSQVWQAMTDATLLDRWWAPRPWRAQTLHMDFQVGGYWHYAMKGPDGDEHYGRMSFVEIEPGRRYKAIDVFADASGEANDELPKQTFVTTLAEDGHGTKLVTVIRYESLEDLEKIIEMGMQEGLTIAQDQLEQLVDRG